MLQLAVISPSKKIMETEVGSVTVPTKSGEITILPAHAPLFSLLVPGEIKAMGKDRKEISIIVNDGFVSVHDNRVSILTDFGVKTEEINEQAIMEAKIRAERGMSEKKNDEEFAKAEAEFYRAILQLKMVQKKKHHG